MDPAALEAMIEAQIESLPGPLQKQWMSRLEAAENDDLPAIDEALRDFLQKRERILVHTAPGTLGELKHADRDAARIQKTLERIAESTARPDLYVGAGNTAEVHRDVQDPAICYKLVTNFEKYEAWNSIGREAHFLEELEDVVVEGVRTPRVISVIDRPDIKAITMEYLDAENLTVLMEKRKALPPNFDVDDFFRRVRAYIDELHRRGIYHRDLHGGNVLLGRDGTPYVIDFGQAATAFSAEHAYDAYDRTGENKVVLTSDELYLESLEAALRAYANTPAAQGLAK